MMAASGKGIRGKGGREEAGAGAPPESAGSEVDWEAGDPPFERFAFLNWQWPPARNGGNAIIEEYKQWLMIVR